MELRKILGLIVFVCLVNSVMCQNVIIDSVVFDGIGRTKSSYLKRFLEVKESDSYDSLQVSEDMRRLRTISSILDVYVDTIRTEAGVILKYSINNRRTLLPVGDFGLTDGSLWLGAGLMESNLFGRGLYVYGYLQYKTPFAAHFIVKNPYLFGSRWGYQFQYKSLDVYETDLNYQVDAYKQMGYSIAAKFELQYEKDVLAGLGYRTESVILQDVEIDRKESLRYFLEFRFQRLNYLHFMQEGWQNFFSVYSSAPLTQHADSYSLFNELRVFRIVGKQNFAARLLTGISSEEELYYLPYFADSYKSIRGSGYRFARGNRLFATNLEYRLSVFENHHFGGQVVGFVDAGRVAYRIDKSLLEETNMLYTGAGVRLIVKKIHNAVLSIDYGFNTQDPSAGGWVIGWGQYF